MLRRKLRGALAVMRNFLCFSVVLLLIFVYKMKIVHQHEVATKISKRAIKYVDFNAQEELKPLQINTIKRLITKYNSEERILNSDFFGPLKTDAPVFVVFVDKYKINLKYLLVSFAQVLGIEDGLLIFSHLSYDENVNNLIKSIDFVRVLQIFYPYSLQIYPHEFPGFENGDCPHNIDIGTAQSVNCTGAESPDIHGRYRDPLQAQIKHYWWWTMNTVFENLAYIKDHKGIFTFLEDDLYLTEDIIYMTSHMKLIGNFITECEFVSLETSSYRFSYFDLNTYSVKITTWDPHDHFSVLSFDSSVWTTISAHYYLFCSIDDYSWSRSLYYLSLNRKDGGRFKVITSIMPRAFKTSSSALYEKLLDYDMMNTIFRIMKMQELNKLNLYPALLEVYLNIEIEDDDAFIIFDYVDNNGGWSDVRDKKLCSNITTNKIKKVIMDMNQEFHQYEFAQSA